MLGEALVRSGESLCGDIEAPDPALLDLPEKAVTFGTGVFLRGFVGYFIDEANRQGRFGGRIVAVASTESGRHEALNRQDGLYTLAVRSGEPGAARRRLIASYSRALSARSDWRDVLALAHRPELELIFSNTTEAGITLDPDDSPLLAPPRSFPGKLARFLYERARAFDYAEDRGVIVLPCELIDNNGDRLREIVLTLARRCSLDTEFLDWVERAVSFCNTLVDRIVTGPPNGQALERIWAELGYRDELLATCEEYRLFAIQADNRVRARLDFADADPAVVLASDIAPLRERKARLLNGTHTLLAPTASLCGCQTVAEATQDADLHTYLRLLLLDELAPTIDSPGAEDFALDVLERFANPFLRHSLRDIMLEQTAKMRIRVVPTLRDFVRTTGRPPASIAFGFAAWLLSMRPEPEAQSDADDVARPPDKHGERVRAFWQATTGDGQAARRDFVRAVCADRSLWDTDLTELHGFAEAVTEHLARAEREGMRAALAYHVATPSGVAADSGH